MSAMLALARRPPRRALCSPRYYKGVSASLLCRSRRLTVLALESSADDTCAAVVTSSGEILSNVVVKQNHIHEDFGGIHPYRAVQAHQQNMPGAVERALTEAGLDARDVDGIAFTRGPGEPFPW
ncbi:glycoprotease family-domain-containing protein [Gloeopeniophorella convolvens]|nr:glycoprotease family-domain-containing protein [Gloeopeniophorella convolvens]